MFSTAFSPDGSIVASGGSDHTVRLWWVNDGRHLRTLEGHNGEVCSVAFSPDKQLLVSGPTARVLRLWWVGDGRLIRAINGAEVGTFSYDGRRLLSGSADRVVRVWGISYYGRDVQDIR